LGFNKLIKMCIRFFHHKWCLKQSCAQWRQCRKETITEKRESKKVKKIMAQLAYVVPILLMYHVKSTVGG